MQVFHDQGLPIDTLVRLNRCRLYLNLYFTSEVFTQSGTRIKPAAFLTSKGPVINTFLWPRQGPPSQDDWELWRAHVQSLTESTVTLGDWLPSIQGDWWYDPLEGKLFQKEDQRVWLSFTSGNRSRRGAYFHIVGTTQPRNLIYLAQVNKYKNYQVLHVWCRIPQFNPKIQSLKQFIAQMSESERWSVKMLKSCRDDGEYIAANIYVCLAMAIRDGSYKEDMGGFAWVFKGELARNRLIGCNRVPGMKEDQSAYRS